MPTDYDQYMAMQVRNKITELRIAVESAISAGLKVEVPELLHLHISHGCASGSPSDWKIYRSL